MNKVTNTDSNWHYWWGIYDPATDRQLELGPGESAEVDLPEGFSNPHLLVEDIPEPGPFVATAVPAAVPQSPSVPEPADEPQE